MNDDEEVGKNEESKVSNVAQNATEKAKGKIINRLKKSIKSGAAKQSVMAALGPILLWAFVIIVIIIVIIGIAMFLVTMPGMVMEQIKALFSALGNYVAAFFGADTTAQIKEEDIYETLDYLSNMGYDLKGYGFITDYKTNADVEDGQYLDEDLGVVKSEEDDTIVKASSDFIAAYIISDNYVYTLKNNNFATQEDTNNWFEKISTAVATAWYRVQNFVFGPLFDVMGVTNAAGERWGKGLIALYYEEGKQVGVQGTFVNTGSFWNWDGMKINTQNKTLSISRNEFLNTNNAIEYSLDGWSGRYGMPVEFLLSVHIATLMPDLALDMAQSFPTEVNIYLHDVSGEAISAYKNSSGQYITYEELNKALTGFAGKNLFSAVISWFDNLSTTDKEVQIASKLGIDHASTCTCTSSEIEGYFYGASVVYKDDKGYYYLGADTDGSDINVYIDESYVTVTTSVEYDTICDDCRNYLQKVTNTLAAGNDYNFKAYVPYIANVTNHWYRDVYFVINRNFLAKNYTGNLEFVDYDYEYEAMMKERWTLYETYSYDENPDKAGEYKLYRLDNGELYNGTSEDAEKENVTVVKKAVTVKSSDTTTLEDLGWNNNSTNVWTAYEEDTETSDTGYERIYTDEELASITDQIEKEVKEKLYINLSMTGNIVQTGEGQRTETNSTIKKIFLENNYFKYDGSKETAEIITELRKKVAENHGSSVYYGALSDSDLKKTATITSDDGETKTYTVGDYAGVVSLEQDSLNAFSMLENTHTLDADYIYRDFKELVVELGYFTKEELTDETPRLLEWIVPDIASGGFPDRTIDKDESEYGTKIHSKGDIEANEKNTLMAMYQQAAEELKNGERTEDIDSGDAGTDVSITVSGLNNTSSSIGLLDNLKSNANIEQIVGSMGSNFERVVEKGDGYEYKVKVGSVEYTHYYQFSGSYAEQTFTWSGETKTIHKAGCGPTSCVNILTGYGKDVNPTNDIIGINFSATIDGIKSFMESYGVSGQSYSGLSDSEYVEKIKEAFAQGKPIITLMHKDKTGDPFWTSGGHFVAMIGQDTNGNIITLDCGSSNAARHTYTGGVEGLMSTLVAVWIADEAPNGSSASGSQYTGYEGNEAVVSPVTGILLEYGTYDTEVDSITGEEYRVNTDLKNGINNVTTSDSGETTPTDTSTEIVHDKVGYAKILVLDAESYQKLESSTSNSWQSDTLVKIKDGTTSSDSSYDTDKAKATFIERLTEEEEMEDWSNLDKTIYGYKEFAESYEKYGIAGYVVYIDGFVCELPDDSLEVGDDSEMAEQLPKGKTLTMSSFQKITASDLTGTDPLESDDVIDSKYEKDDEYKLASKKATNKLNAESSVKEQANSTIYANNLVFIKEGTVIGRTMTDKELVEKIRKEKDKTYDYYRPDGDTSGDDSAGDTENADKVIGNYIRIIMRDLDDTVVENVEDYMKIDELASGTSIVGGNTFIIPDEVLEAQTGAQITYEAINRSELGMSQWSSGTTQRSLYELWKKQGSRATNGTTTGSLEAGVAVITIDGKDYVPVAVKEGFGNPGDYIQITFENGEILDAIIGDAKGTDSGSFKAVGDHGEMDYGHSSDGTHCNVLEVMIKGKRSGDTYVPGDTSGFKWWGKKVTKIVNAGSIYP